MPGKTPRSQGRNSSGFSANISSRPVLPAIRHYGFLSSASKTKSLAVIRADLKVSHKRRTTQKPWQEIAIERMGIKPGVCRCCGGKMIVIEIIPNQFGEKQRAPPTGKLTNKPLVIGQVQYQLC
jgi:hypothetical protein